MEILVIDGQGGGVGRALVEQIRRAYPNLHIGHWHQQRGHFRHAESRG